MNKEPSNMTPAEAAEELTRRARALVEEGLAETFVAGVISVGQADTALYEAACKEGCLTSQSENN